MLLNSVYINKNAFNPNCYRAWCRYILTHYKNTICHLPKINYFSECRSVTDSVGSHSDISAHTNTTMTKPHMEVVCVIDICQTENLAQRKKALEEVRMACIQVGASLSHIQVCLQMLNLFAKYLSLCSFTQLYFCYGYLESIIY